MGIKPQFDEKGVRDFLKQKSEFIFNAVVNRVRLEGESFIVNARNNGNYNDITGNLRSSVGYIIIWNGKEVAKNFPEAGKGSDQETGTKKGYDLAKSLINKFKNSISLICVAGMDYAAKVESNGKDVITGSTQTLEEDLKKSIKELERKLNG